MPKSKFIYTLYWDSMEGDKPLIETTCPEEEFGILMEEYEKTDEEGYNVPDFVEYLNKKHYKTRLIEPIKEFYF